jgi:7tm Odorant receptor
VSMTIHISFMVAVISQLYKYAQGGQHIVTEVRFDSNSLDVLKNLAISIQSQLVSNAIYCSAWYEAGPKIRKKLLFALMRAQKAVIVDGIFFEAALPSFTSV